MSGGLRTTWKWSQAIPQVARAQAGRRHRHRRPRHANPQADDALNSDRRGGNWRSAGHRNGGRACASGRKHHRILAARAVIIGKFLELLKQMEPNVSRVVVFNPDNPTNYAFQAGNSRASRPRSRSILSSPISMDWAMSSVPSRDEHRPMAAFCSRRMSRWVPARERIVALVARSRLPATYSDPIMVKDGGLMSYGPRCAQYISTSGIHRPHPQG